MLTMFEISAWIRNLKHFWKAAFVYITDFWQFDDQTAKKCSQKMKFDKKAGVALLDEP